MTKILLADIVYERSGASPLIVPMPIGGIANYAKEYSKFDLDIRVVRTIDQYIKTISAEKFDIAGFSHYCWNARLSGIMARKLKAAQPACVVIFGGPNIPIDTNIQENFVRKHPQVDLFIEKEGEIAFTNCIDSLIACDFDINLVKEMELPSLRSVLNGNFITSPLESRIKDLDIIPSPYLNGLMDQFLELGFTPILQTKRGCPFSCEFCGEGEKYHTSISRYSLERLHDEIKYLSRKMSSLQHLEFSKYLYLCDSNSGMYREDLECANFLKEAQMNFDWPRTIIASTGKNSKDRTIEYASRLDGALSMTASVQSTDMDVLKNIKRDNVSIDVMKKVAIGVSSHEVHSEVILGLPGDTYGKHLKTIKDLMDSRIPFISILQLIILADTPMASPSYIGRYGLDVRYRLLAKGAAKTEIEGKFVTVAEIEAVCVGNKEMSFENYQSCRTSDFFVALFYNHIFSEGSFDWFENAEKSPFEYLQALLDQERPLEFSMLVDNFLDDLEKELYEDASEIEDLLNQEETYDLIKSNKLGFNITLHYIQKSIEMNNTVLNFALCAAEKVGGADFRDILQEDIRLNAKWGNAERSINQRSIEHNIADPKMFSGAMPR